MHETYTERRIRQEEKRHSLKDMATEASRRTELPQKKRTLF